MNFCLKFKYLGTLVWPVKFNNISIPTPDTAINNWLKRLTLFPNAKQSIFLISYRIRILIVPHWKVQKDT